MAIAAPCHIWRFAFGFLFRIEILDTVVCSGFVALSWLRWLDTKKPRRFGRRGEFSEALFGSELRCPDHDFVEPDPIFVSWKKYGNDVSGAFERLSIG